MTTSVTPAARCTAPKAPRAASYTKRWDTIVRRPLSATGRQLQLGLGMAAIAAQAFFERLHPAYPLCQSVGLWHPGIDAHDATGLTPR
ncbi:hypothetical protein JYP51_22155 [Ponticoccus gilvus]|nr:hypothetical protein [Enemella evansiae]